MKKSRLLSILLSAFLIVSMMPAMSFAGTAKSNDIVILVTSDTHCNLDGSGFLGFKEDVNIARGNYNNVAVVDNGDAMQGNQYGMLTKGKAIVKVMNAIGYDVCVPGNHDFDYGADYFLKTIVPSMKAQYTSCNFVKAGKTKAILAPYIIKSYEQNGQEVQVAYLGITTPSTLVTSRQVNFQDKNGKYKYDFCNDTTGNKLYKQVQAAVDQAREAGADYVIGLGHLGNTDSSKPWKASEVVANTDGIDVMVDGHAHMNWTDGLTNKSGKKVQCIAIGSNLTDYGRIKIFEADGSIDVTDVTKMPSTTTDKNYLKVINKVKADIKKKTGNVVATAKVDLTINNVDGSRAVRLRETNLGDLCADAVRAVCKADIGIINGGSVRTSINKGKITIADVLAVFPFSNEVGVCEASGQQILDALEFTSRSLPGEQGGFLQVSGLSYKVNAKIPTPIVVDEKGSFKSINGERRVYDVKVGKKLLNPKKTYTVASTTYVLKDGGDGLNIFMNNKFIQHGTMLDNEMFATYLQKNLKGVVGSKYASAQGRIEILSDDEVKRQADEKAVAEECAVIAKYRPQLKVKAVKKAAKLSWSKCAVKDVKYKVYAKKKGDKKFILKLTTDKTSCEIAKLKKGKTYSFKVVTIKEYGNGSYTGRYSAVKKATIK